MKLTEDQIKTLSAYEQYFETAVNGNWARYPGAVALQQIHRIMEDVTGTKRPLNTNCQSCVLNLLKDCGILYFEAKKARAVDLTGAEAAPVKKVAVKTTKRRTK